MKRLAFTLLELVFVIIVIGILAVLAMPSFTINPLQQAAEQVASHIRYTQHLAMVNDVFDEGEQNWHRARIQISFRDCNDGRSYYYIGSDRNLNTGHIAESEAAINPLNNKTMYWLNTQCQEDTYPTRDPSLLLTDQFGVTLNSNCGGTISFDNTGRPYDVFAATPIMGQLANDCNLTLVHPNDGNATITIQPETGYVSVIYN
jgi:prepilin-type N-terminal cleavage/methylation domain-containing protein